MRSKKTYIILILLLLSFAIIMYLLIGKDYLDAGRRNTVVVVGDTSVWEYSDKVWTNIKKKNWKRLYWEEFNVYEDNKELGNYYLWNDDEKWLFFDKDRNEIETTGKTLSYQANYNLKIDKFKEEEIDIYDDKYIEQVLSENNLEEYDEFTSNYKVNIDYDKDEVVETFYILSNVFPMDFEPNKIFSIVFMVKDSKIYYLYKSIDNNQGENGCKPYINYFLDINKDGKDEIILSCGKYSERGTIDMLYQFDDEMFKILISNQ